MIVKRISFLLFAMVIVQGSGASAHSFVLVHLGKQLPIYLSDAIAQVRLFNQSCPIYLIASQTALSQAEAFKDRYKVTFIATESLQKTAEHILFLQKTKFTEPFWLYTCERFLYVHDFMQQYKEQDVIHIENDVMVYANFGEMMPLFKAYYKGIAAVFDNDDRCIPGFMYIANGQVMAKLAQCFVLHASHGEYDMRIIALFKQQNTINVIDGLPIITESYVCSKGLKSRSGLKTENPELYHKNINQFQSIFDAAAIGQYLGGNDPIHKGAAPGFVNESCLFNVSDCEYCWDRDLEGRRVPYMIFQGQKCRINNLHVHSKRLREFAS